MNNSKCVILVPAYSSIDRECERGLRELEGRGYVVRREFDRSDIVYARSLMASSALIDGFDELMWIDSDIGFNPDDIDKLRSHDLPFCCALYPKKSMRGPSVSLDSTVAFGFLLEGKQNIVFGKGGGLIELAATGFGFVHTRRHLYDQIKTICNLPECIVRSEPVPLTPFFFPEIYHDGTAIRYAGEDFAFCHRARKAGYKIMADTSILLLHIGRHSFSWGDIK